MKEVPLTRGRVALVDDEDYDAVIAAGKWAADVCDGHLYARRKFRLGKHSVTVAMHSFITGYRLADHINGDGLDNRKANLRPATPSQNSQNQRRQINKTGFKGVGLHKFSGLWRAYICVQGRQISLGYHRSPEAAARAYDAAALEHFGEFANLNFPQETAAA